MTDQAHQVANAASLVVRPDTDAATRAAASSFLESWTQSTQAWDLYGPWLESFLNHHNAYGGVELLCLQLLQAKIRREIPRGTHSNASLDAIRLALIKLILQSQSNLQALPILQSACICLVSLQVRISAIHSFLPSILSSCGSHHGHDASPSDSLTPWTALRLLTEIPTELETCADSPSQVASELVPHWEHVQSALLQHLMAHQHHHATDDACRLQAVQALAQWVGSCHVTLSALNTAPSHNQNHAVLPRLVELLSQSQYKDEALLTAVSKCLSTVLLQPADSCTPTRQTAVVALVDATRVDGFIGGPLQCATVAEWDDASHALVSLLTTLVTEDIDEIIQLPAQGLLHLALEIQRTHPSVRIRSLVLEAWLTVQDVPTAERHEHWRARLLSQITETLLQALAYPANFTTWEDEINVEESDFDEYRRLAPDVLVGCYNMLRVDFVKRLSAPLLTNSTSTWIQREASLYALTATAREICGRLKTTVGGTRIIQDRQATADIMSQLASALCRTTPQPAVLANTQSQFWGTFASAWARMGSTECVLQILEQLRHVLEQHSSASAAKATKSLLTVSAVPLLTQDAATVVGPLVNLVQRLFTIALGTHVEEVMLAVAEGSVRLLVDVQDKAVREHSLLALMQALITQGSHAIHAIPINSSVLTEESIAAVEALGKYLKVLGVLVKFAQSDIENGSQPVLANALSQYAWPFLDSASQRMHAHSSILDAVLGVQQQLLRSTPDLLSGKFHSTIQHCVAIFEQSKSVSTLAYFSSAVEAYGAQQTSAFESLLNHVSQVFFNFVSSEKPIHECTQLVEAYFEMCQRYLLFCPAAIVQSEALPSIASCAMECLTACKGERDSTRAALNFLEKIVAWRRLPVSTEARQALEIGSQRLDQIISVHGQRLVQLCIEILVDGPRMLWPVASEVVYAVVLATINWPVPEASNSCVARQLLEHVSFANLANKFDTKDPTNAYQHIVSQLLEFAQKGSSMKAKAKMLLSDFFGKAPDTVIA